ncbi:MAG TPA: aminoglycoside phosphotransferase family protein [Ruania sp.]|nr:aminoglycoside phosphotransferase family protein [Ruania sp.]
MAAEGRVRLTWAELPDGVAHLVSGRLGDRVVGAVSHDGGYSPGLASTLVLASGERVFVKAVAAEEHPFSGELYRKEAVVAEVLAAEVGAVLPAPAFRWAVEEAVEDGTGEQDWVVLAFDAADGPGPQLPWQPAELAEALDLVADVGRIEAPEHPRIPPVAAMVFQEWHLLAADTVLQQRLAGLDEVLGRWLLDRMETLAALADTWPQVSAGSALVHHDLRADNMVRAGGRLLAVDWPYASVGAPWLDLLGMMPSMALEGGGDPGEVFTAHPVGSAADPDAVTAVVAAFAGYFLHEALQPPPPGIPHVRAFQRDQGLVCAAWLRTRLGR